MLTTKQVQNQLGVTRQTLYLWRKQGIIAVIKKKNGRILWDENEILRLKKKLKEDKPIKKEKTNYETSI